MTETKTKFMYHTTGTDCRYGRVRFNVYEIVLPSVGGRRISIPDSRRECPVCYKKIQTDKHLPWDTPGAIRAHIKEKHLRGKASWVHDITKKEAEMINRLNSSFKQHTPVKAKKHKAAITCPICYFVAEQPNMTGKYRKHQTFELNQLFPKRMEPGYAREITEETLGYYVDMNVPGDAEYRIYCKDEDTARKITDCRLTSEVWSMVGTTPEGAQLCNEEFEKRLEDVWGKKQNEFREFREIADEA